MDLPTELLLQILDYLHLNTLHQLSQVNRHCSAICAPMRYRHITLPHQGHQRYVEHLQPLKRYVRVVEIVFARDFRSKRLLSPAQYPRGYTTSFDPISGTFFDPLRYFLHTTLVVNHWENPNQLSQLVRLPPFQGHHLHIRRDWSISHDETQSNWRNLFSLTKRCHGDDTGKAQALDHQGLSLAEPGQLLFRCMQAENGPLTSLTLQCRPGSWDGILHELATLTSLRELRSLNMDTVTAEDGEFLLTQTHQFGNLRRLQLDHAEQPNFLETFVSQLNLHELELPSVSGEALGTILDSIGHHLTHLFCTNNSVDVDWLLQHLPRCEQLEELGIGVQRHQGTERPLLESIGRLPKLKKLQLHISSKRFIGYEIPKTKRLPDKMNLAFETLRDLAMDEPLARSIFQAVSSAHSSSSLTRLEIRMRWPMLYYNHSMSDVSILTWQVAKDFLCTSETGDQSTSQLMVTPLRALRTLMFPPGPEYADIVATRHKAPVVRQLWPKAAHMPFSQAWHSFPIDEDSRPQYQEHVVVSSPPTSDIFSS